MMRWMAQRRKQSCRRPAGRRWAAGAALLALLSGAPMAAAAPAPDENEARDGRLEGFTSKDTTSNGQANVPVALEKSGTGMSYIMFGVLTVISIGVLFKDAKRSHLD